MIRIAVLAVAFVMVACSMAYAQEPRGSGNRTLVVFFSKTGNTQALAEEIHRQVGGDIFEVVTVKVYPEDYHETTVVAKAEQENNERPELRAYVENMDQYDTIFVGFPNWWGSMPMGMYTFLERYDFTGKTIVPFLTHGGGGVQRCEQDINKVCSKATVKPALILSGSQGRNSQQQVSSWLQRINLK